MSTGRHNYAYRQEPQEKKRFYLIAGISLLLAAVFSATGYLVLSQFDKQPGQTRERYVKIPKMDTDMAGQDFAVKVTEVTADNGVAAWLIEDHTAPVIAVEIMFTGGTDSDPDDKVGLSSLVSGLLDEGAGAITSQEFQEVLANHAIRLSFDAETDRFTGYLKTTRTHHKLAFNLLRMALTQPRFDEEPVERIRRQLLTILARESEDPGSVAFKSWRKQIFASHPYARHATGTIEGLENITRNDLKNFVKTRLAKSSMVVGIAGDITASEVKALLQTTFDALPDTAQLPQIETAELHTDGSTVFIDMPIPQAVAVFGHAGVTRHDPDFYPVHLVNYMLGGGSFSSRLMEEVRAKRGLVYGIGSGLSTLEKGPLVIGQFATPVEKTADALALVREQWQNIAEHGPTADELAKTKQYLIGSFPLRFSSMENLAGIAAIMQYEKLGIDFLQKRNDTVRAITLNDVTKAARKYFTADKLTTTIVGPKAELEKLFENQKQE